MDIVERLRRRRLPLDIGQFTIYEDDTDCLEAADEIERLREALWQCGFWARNAEADDKMARLKIAHEAEKILSPEYWAFKREDDIAERWED